MAAPATAPHVRAGFLHPAAAAGQTGPPTRPTLDQMESQQDVQRLKRWQSHPPQAGPGPGPGRAGSDSHLVQAGPGPVAGRAGSDVLQTGTASRALRSHASWNGRDDYPEPSSDVTGHHLSGPVRAGQISGQISGQPDGQTWQTGPAPAGWNGGGLRAGSDDSTADLTTGGQIGCPLTVNGLTESLAHLKTRIFQLDDHSSLLQSRWREVETEREALVYSLRLRASQVVRKRE